MMACQERKIINFKTMTELTEKLQKEMPIKWRIQSYSQNKPSCSCVAYIDSRDVQARLDEVFGADGWSDDYKVINGRLFCGITAKGQTKWDCGTESNMDKEKGEASDAFKRAAVKWGVGRFLYSLEIKYLKTNEPLKKINGKAVNSPYPIDDYGQRIWDITKRIKEQSNKQKHV